MANTFDDLVVQGNATFGGGSTTGSLTSGIISVAGNFTQSGAATSFDASGTHTVELNGSTAQTVSFANPGAGAGSSHFLDLEINNGSLATVSLASNVFADGQLIRTLVDGTNRVINGGGFTLTVQGLNASELTFDNLPVVLNDGATFTTFDAVVFQNMSTTVVQLLIQRASGTISLGLSTGITFSTPPTGAGRYISAVDTNIPDALNLRIEVSNPSPASATLGVDIQTDGTATIVWPYP
jgi:hypothetical protein